MHDSVTRRGFIGASTVALSMTALGARARAQAQAAPKPAETPPSAAPRVAPPAAEPYEPPPALKPEDVRAFVGVAHRDVAQVRSMLDAQPTLVNASWDWTGGDWESAMGAGGHTGRVEICELLLERGARIELHAAAMMGWLEVIKAAVTAKPGAENILGPHGIPMWSHADTGGERAKEVLAYLESLNAVRDLDIADGDRARYVGRYRLEADGREWVVGDRFRRVTLQPPDARAWRMLHQGDAIFRPADELGARVTFEVKGDRVLALHIDKGVEQVVAVRVD